MNIFVTGGAGFIGSHFVRYLLAKYPTYRVINYDLMTYAGNHVNLFELEKDERHHFHQGNITDREYVNRLFLKYKIDAVVHFAAESHVDRSIVDPDVFIKTNSLGTNVLLECAKSYKVEKFIQISTDEVYGSLGKEGSFTEASPIAPTNPYAASKAAADLLVQSYFRTYGLNVNITRCSNNYGPHQHPEKLIPLMITRAMKGRKLPVYGNGHQIRDWIHVHDHCRAIDKVLHHGKAGEIYNIGAGEEHKNIDIIRFVLRELSVSTELIEHVSDRLGHDYRYAIDPTKLENQLGWRPIVDFEQGLQETIDWYRHNEGWWRALEK